MKHINIKISDKEFALLSAIKGDRTWREYIMKDVLNQGRRQQLQILINNQEADKVKSA